MTGEGKSIYLSGPMRGIPQFNFPAFDAAAELLRNDGYDVVSPAELDSPEDRAMALASADGHIRSVEKSWGDFLARDVKLIADGGIDGIVVLRGWERSRGARLETFVAFLCGLPVYSLGIHEYGGVELNAVGLLRLARGWLAKDDISFYKPEVAA